MCIRDRYELTPRKKGQCSLSAAMSTTQAPQAQIAKRLQLSRDQKALLETVYAMEKLPQRQNPTGVITSSLCGLYCTPLVQYAAAPDFLADHRLEPTLQRDLPPRA